MTHGTRSDRMSATEAHRAADPDRVCLNRDIRSINSSWHAEDERLRRSRHMPHFSCLSQKASGQLFSKMLARQQVGRHARCVLFLHGTHKGAITEAGGIGRRELCW